MKEEEAMAGIPKKVVQCDRNGNEIRCFDSAKIAALSLGSESVSHIHKAIRYGLTFGGYRWKYLGDELRFASNGTKGRVRKVVAVSILNGEETTYPSISDASRKTGIGLTAIENSLQTGNKAKGYRFRYTDADAVTPAKQNPLTRQIEAVDEVGQVVATYPSAKKASKALGVSLSMIYWCTAHKESTRRCKGYRLRYKAM